MFPGRWILPKFRAHPEIPSKDKKMHESTQASTEPKTCAQCKEKIQGSILTALGKSWHPDHFACEACKEPITETKFRTHEDKPYCTGCHIKHFANTCHACDEPILDKCVQAMGVNWHEDHFLCGGCKCKLIGTQFMDVKGAPFCQKCYLSKHADRCKGCSKPIADKAVVALDAKWHQMCFRCSKCDKPITSDQTFQVDQGKPQCVKC
ncbi:transforming growth factor beta-1-induced transcript 1 protein-like isoform X3 [Anthonomus grandis grandis]|uniref:transforming growth factor beta-1-induced transcript 1 protein-like isoform X3 n=1 Tax=Anthonomus grandis grandis TaxID=2921223 RepID=UPI002166B6F6|nr:transforming growth factor beta-1-induced transcript 1 protein-like isoform X3 [Anthonomus grandis grandis]